MRRQHCAGTLLACLLLLFAGCNENTPVEDERTRTPDFLLTDLDGNDFQLSKHQGKVIVLNFFRAGCSLCQSEAPELVALDEQFADEKVVIVGLGLSSPDDLRAFARSFGVTYRILPASTAHFNGYGVTNTPTVFLINREGWIFGRYEGAVGKELLAGRINELLK